MDRIFNLLGTADKKLIIAFFTAQTFNFYINTILNNSKHIFVPALNTGFKGLMFADDTVIACDSINDIKYNLEQLQNWCNESEMEINPSKCGIMWIKPYPNDNTIPEIKHNGEIIPQVEKYIYLGIEFNNQLDIDKMSNYRINLGKAALQQLAKSITNEKIAL